MKDAACLDGLVSVVLPTYRRANVLAGAMRSVLAQTYRNLELIVVDDNSPDDTPAVVASFEDPRVRYVRNEPNLKLPRALNRGFSLARGAYLTWTSDDNLYHESALERMTSVLHGGGCDFVFADYYIFNELGGDGKPLRVHHDKLPDDVKLQQGNNIGACFLYTRRVYESVGEYDPELFLVEDFDYFIRIARKFRMHHIAEPLYYFRRHDDALYCSRYAEVNASDVLVRYKNGLLSETDVLDAVVALLLRNVDGLNSAFLRWSDRQAQRLSYRLSVAQRRLLGRYLHWRLRHRLTGVLLKYRARDISFAAARDALCTLIRELGTLAYTQPRFE